MARTRKLVAGLELDYNASFSFDGEWVVFTSERYGSADIEAPVFDIPQPYGELIIMKIDGSDKRPLTDQPMGGRHARVADCASDEHGQEIDSLNRTVTTIYLRNRE